MKPRVVELTVRGRGLEWLTLGFSLSLVSAAIGALLSVEIRSRFTGTGRDGIIELHETLGAIDLGLFLFSVVAIAIGGTLLFRAGVRRWSAITLAALALHAVRRTAIFWLPYLVSPRDFAQALRLIGLTGAVIQLLLAAAALMAVRAAARADGTRLPAYLLVGVVGAELIRAAAVVSGHQGHRLFPGSAWQSPVFFVALSALGIGSMLAATRIASAAARAQLWAGDPDGTAPARAADWQRAAAGLDRFSLFLIARASAALIGAPFLLLGAGMAWPGLTLAMNLVVLPIAAALTSAGMVASLFAFRRAPDPPDARTAATGAALLIGICLLAEVYVLWATTRGFGRMDHPAHLLFADSFSALALMIAYTTVLRAVARVGDRIGESAVSARARTLTFVVPAVVGGATVIRYLVLRGGDDRPLFAAGVVLGAAALSFAALLPSALVARALARRMSERFTEPPRARVHAG